MRRLPRRRDRGMLLGIVLILLAIVMLGGALALSGVSSDTSAAGADRLSRQLFDCAEIGLEWGKQAFSGTYLDWSGYLNASNVCSYFSCAPSGPFHAGTGTAPTGYPDSYPYKNSVTIGTQTLTYRVGIYDNDDDSGTSQVYTTDTDGQIVVYSICTDSVTGQSKAVQAVIKTQVPTNTDYAGQAGYGFRGQGNQN